MYAFVSNWLLRECTKGKLPFVPHIVRIPDRRAGNLQEDLAISADGFLVGCTSSSQSFHIPFAKVAVRQALEKRPDPHFVFFNIQPFAKHERVRFLPAQVDLGYEAKFIATCDAMLHARKLGESFGLACWEFSIANKPVLTYANLP